jgi:hypothetical protein
MCDVEAGNNSCHCFLEWVKILAFRTKLDPARAFKGRGSGPVLPCTLSPDEVRWNACHYFSLFTYMTYAAFGPRSRFTQLQSHGHHPAVSAS